MEHVFSVYYETKDRFAKPIKDYIYLMTSSPKIPESEIWQRALEEANNKAKEINAKILQIRKLL